MLVSERLASGLRARLRESFGALADVYRTADLRRLGFAYLTSLVALWAYGIGISVYAFQIGGATLVGIAAVIRLVPAAVVAPFAAVLADRHPRRRVLMVTDLTRAVLVALACAAIALGLPPLVVFCIAGLNTMVSTVFEPAKNALTPELAAKPEQLTAANTAMSTFESTSIFIGPALGGLVLAAGSVQLVFAMTGVLLLFSAAQISRIGHSAVDKKGSEESDGGRLAEAMAGFRAVASDWQLRTLIGLFAAQLLVDGLLMVLTVSVAIDLLDMGRAGVGYLNSAVGIGGLIGAVVTLMLTGRRGMASLFGIGLAGWGLPILLIGLIPQTIAALLLLDCPGSSQHPHRYNCPDPASAGRAGRCARACVRRARKRDHRLCRDRCSACSGPDQRPRDQGGIDRQRRPAADFGCDLQAGAAQDRCLAPPPTRELELLEAIPMFSGLGAAPLEELAARLESVRRSAGEVIIRQGDRGDRFFVIDQGEVEVYEDGKLARREGPGEYFGEIALLRDIPRTATVKAATDVELRTLERQDFLDAVTRDRISVQAAEAVVASRLGSVRRRPTGAPAPAS